MLHDLIIPDCYGGADMTGYIAIPSHRLVESKNQKTIHFNTKEEMEKHFGITPARMDSLLNSGSQAWRGFFFDEEISGVKR